MKRALTLTAAIALCACQPPVDETLGAFEAFPVARVQPTECVFTAVDAADSEIALFVTRKDDLDHMGYARFKGETLKLVPREVPDLSGETIDVTYEVVDYLKWKVRVEATRQTDASYTGSISLLGSDVSAQVTGRCDG